MTANLSPEYHAAEEAQKAAREPDEKLACLERMLATIPKHKGTEKMQADLKRRIAKARETAEQTGGKKGFAVRVEREGAAQVVLVGAPNAGKSALVEAATNAKVEIGDHPFTTRSPAPAMLPYENVRFQLVDLPPVSREHMEHWVTDIIRTADSALWVVDAADADFAARLDEVVSVLAERKLRLVPPAEASKSRAETVRRVGAVTVATKTDDPASAEVLPRLRERLPPGMPWLALSALGDSDFSPLGHALFDAHAIVRAYPKVPGKDPDRSVPFILRRGDTVLDFARMVHKDFAEHLKYARIWGHGKFEGQRVPWDEPLTDGDVIELHL
jgi:ribosome-interacting GTPase 1